MKCLPLLHRWSRWSKPYSYGFSYQSKTCLRCGKAKERRV